MLVVARFCAAAVLLAGACQAARVSFATNAFRVVLGRTVHVPVTIASADLLGSLSADLLYEAAAIRIVDRDGDAVNGMQPDIEFCPSFPGADLHAAALEDDVEGRLVWGVTQRAPATNGFAFPAPVTVFTAAFTTVRAGTNMLNFGHRTIIAPAGGYVTTMWDTAYVTVLDDNLPKAVIEPLPAYSAGTSRSLAWQPVPDAQWYRALCSTTMNFSSPVFDSGLITATNYTFSPLANATHYFYTVVASNEIGQFSMADAQASTQDTVPPQSPSLSINGGATYAGSPALSLALSATDTSPMTMQVWCSDATATGPLAYATSLPFTVNASQELKTVFAMFTDAAGQTSAVIQRAITLDTTPPAGPGIVIDGGAATAWTYNVALALGATDIAPLSMRIANDAAFSGASWQAFTNALAWTLPTSGAGYYAVYARFRDAAGNMSAAVSDTVYCAALDLPITPIAPANGATVLVGAHSFSWFTGNGVLGPQVLAISDGQRITGASPQTVTLAAGVQSWSVSASNLAGGVSVSPVRTITVMDPPIGPIPPRAVREHQVLFVNLPVSNAADVVCVGTAINGAHYLDADRGVFSLVPDLGTAGEVWNIPFIATSAGGTVTQTLVVTVQAPADGISAKKPLTFEDADGDFLALSYDGISKNGSALAFDGQRVVLSNAYATGKLSFKVKMNKKLPGADGKFWLNQLTMDAGAKTLVLDPSVGTIDADGYDLGTVSINGAVLSNLMANSVKSVAVGKGTMAGTVIIANTLGKLSAVNIVGADIQVGAAAGMSVKIKDSMRASRLVADGTGAALSVKAFSTSGKGTIADSIIVVGLAPDDDYTNIATQAGFKSIKTGAISNTEIAGRDYAAGSATKVPVIKYQSATNSRFYHTTSAGTIQVEPL